MNFVVSGPVYVQMTDFRYRLVTDGINKPQEPKTRATRKNLNDRFYSEFFVIKKVELSLVILAKFVTRKK